MLHYLGFMGAQSEFPEKKEEASMKLKAVLGIGLAALAITAVACSSEEAKPAASATPAPAPSTSAPAATTPASTAPASTAPAASTSVVTVTMKEGPYAFGPKAITVSAGSTLKLVGGKEFHTFTVKDLGIDQIMQAGQTVEVKVPTGKTGTFKLVCLPHEAVGMVGEVIVK
jgi:plastocyanin